MWPATMLTTTVVDERAERDERHVRGVGRGQQGVGAAVGAGEAGLGAVDAAAQADRRRRGAARRPARGPARPGAPGPTLRLLSCLSFFLVVVVVVVVFVVVVVVMEQLFIPFSVFLLMTRSTLRLLPGLSLLLLLSWNSSSFLLPYSY